MNRIVILIVILICLFHVTSTDDWVNSECPCISPRLVKAKQKWYHFQTFRKLNFYSAYRYCNTNGMRLLTIDSKNEESSVVDLIRNSRVTNVSYWTSATCLGTREVFKWMSTGVMIVDKTIWSPGKPDSLQDEQKNCSVLDYNSNWKLQNVPCTNDYYLICENIPQ